MHDHRHTTRILATALLVATMLALGAGRFDTRAQTTTSGTQPIPVTLGWTQESINGLNAINQFRAQQQPPLPALQVDAVLQYAAAWEVNDQFTNGNCFGPNFPYVKSTLNPLSACPHTDSLGRDIGPRLAAFGYTAGAFGENADFGGGDQTPAPVAMGQQAFQDWYDMTDPDANGVPTYAHRKAMINPQYLVAGLARQCDVLFHACFWVLDFGSCMMMPFTPPAGAPLPPAAANPAPGCQNAGPVTLPPATLQVAAAPPTFTGTWIVDGFDEPTPKVNGLLTLTQTGSQVNGSYSYNDPNGCGVQSGTVTGTTGGTGDLLTFNTSETGCDSAFNGGNAGLTIRLSEDGQSFGTGTFWNGTRCGGSGPACPPALTAAQPANTPAPATATPQPAATPVTPTPATPTPAPASTPQPGAAATGWAGNWNTNFGPFTFTLNGNQVSGSYSYTDASGNPATLAITGTASGNTLTGTFGLTPSNPPFGGPITFTLSADGNSFSGNATLPGDGASPWTATRGGS